MYNYGAWGAQPQLPQGWEAKWDPGSRRWFYIDHHTKTTHWELPQMAMTAPQAKVEAKASFVASLKTQYPTATDDVIKQILTSTNNNFIESKTRLESMGYRKKVETIADPKLVKQLVAEHVSVSPTFAESILCKYHNDMDAARKALGDKAKKRQPLTRHVTTLEKEYPNAGIVVIKDVLISTNNSIANSRKALERMGYKKVSPAKKSAPKELSEATKRERLAKLKNRFPDLNERLIKMSLEGTKYDVEMAASVLQKSIKSVENKEGTGTQTSRTTGVRKTSNVTVSSSTSSSNFEPVVFGHVASGFEPVIFGSDESRDKPTAITSTTKKTPKQKTYTPLKPQNVARARVPAAKKIVVKKTVPSGFASQYRCTPSGPNPYLVVGPNLALLQDSMIKPLGPDPMNRCGHQASNCNGPDPANAQGSAGLAVGPLSSALLVTPV